MPDGFRRRAERVDVAVARQARKIVGSTQKELSDLSSRVARLRARQRFEEQRYGRCDISSEAAELLRLTEQLQAELVAGEESVPEEVLASSHYQDVVRSMGALRVVLEPLAFHR